MGAHLVGVTLQHMVNSAPESCKDSVPRGAPRHMPPTQESQQRCFQYAFCWHLPQPIHLRPRSQGCLQTAEEQANPRPLRTAPVPPHIPGSWEREGRRWCEMQWEHWQARGDCGRRSPLCSRWAASTGRSQERCLLPRSMLWMKHLDWHM